MGSWYRSAFFLVFLVQSALAHDLVSVPADGVEDDATKAGVSYEAAEQWEIGPGGPRTQGLDWRHVRSMAIHYGNRMILLQGDPKAATAGALLSEMRLPDTIASGTYSLIYAGFAKTPTLESRRDFVNDIFKFVRGIERGHGALYAFAPHFYSPWIGEALVAAGFVKIGTAICKAVDYDGANRDLYVRFTDLSLAKADVPARLALIRERQGGKLTAFLEASLFLREVRLVGDKPPCGDALAHSRLVTNTEGW